MKHSNVPLPLAEELRRDLIVRFFAEIMQITGNPHNQDAFQHSLQSFVDGLQTWLEPSDGPPNPRAAFSLLQDFSYHFP